MASDAAAYAYFGQSVQIDGNRAVVVAPGVLPQGATYVFHHNGSSWVQEQRLPYGFNGGTTASASIAGNVIVIGNSTAGYSGYNAGAALIYLWNGSAWVQAPKLLASDAATADYFGWSVAAFGDWIVVGARGDDDLADSSGAAYTFKRNNNGTPTNPSDDFWQQTQKLLAPDGAAYDVFGTSVGINGETVVVGAYGGYHAGSAYVYALEGSTWNLATKFSTGYPIPFGSAVAISRDANKIAVGAPGAGKSFVFDKVDSNWIEISRFTDPDVMNAGSNRYGSAVAVSDQFALVGAYGAYGAAYVYDLSTPPSTLTHPADSNTDHSLSNQEFLAYRDAWRQGLTWTRPPSPITNPYLLEARNLWREATTYSNAPGVTCTEPAPANFDPSACWVSP